MAEGEDKSARADNSASITEQNPSENPQSGQKPRFIRGVSTCVIVTNVPAHVRDLWLSDWCYPKQDLQGDVVYFPHEATDMFKENYQESSTTFEHPLIGMAKFYNMVCEGMILKDAAWYYPDPKPDYEEIRNHVTFLERWKKDILGYQAGPDDGVRLTMDFFA